jgi:gamma-glutamylcyclotransferase (GGCT)/AIG2-like uncharacterized protein YtfP
MTGLSNHRVLAGARFVAADRTRPEFTLVELVSFPAMLTDGTMTVIGEVWEVDLPTLKRLDALEGHPVWYRRTPIVLASRRKAETYLMPADRVSRRGVVAGGDWRAWLARYG